MTTRLSRRGVLSLTGAAMAGGALTACSSAGTSPSSGATTGQSIRVWFMEGSISDAAVKHLQDAFAERSPGNTLTVEVQPWENSVSKLQTALASDSQCPDLVEAGNTQCSTFSSVGAFASVDDVYDELGGDDLIPSFVEAGTWDSVRYALPLYAGARGIYYRKDIYSAGGVAEPKTLDEFVDGVITLAKANPMGTPGFTGMHLSAGDEHSVTSLMFSGGGDYAVEEGDKWVQRLTDATTLEAIGRIKRIFSEGTTYAIDSEASRNAVDTYFNDGLIAVVMGTGNFATKVDQALWDADAVGVIPIPGRKAGEIGKTFSGGSTISIPAKAPHPELAREALRVIFSQEFQEIIAADGWVPGNTTYGDKIPGAFGAISATVVENSKLTPNTPQWGVAEGNNLTRDLWTEVAQSADLEAVAAKYGEKLEQALNS